MVAMSYLLGRRYYPVPYEMWRVLGYIAFGVALYLVSQWLRSVLDWHAFVIGTFCMLAFLLTVWLLDGRRLRRSTA